MMRKSFFALTASVAVVSFLFATPLMAETKSQTHHQVSHSTNAVDRPSGKVSMTFRSADIGIGYTWGEGILEYHGKKYPFEIKGGNIVALGYSKSNAQGYVYNLHSLYDFAGSYGAASGEATAGVGIGGANYRNGNNVLIKFDTKTTGGRIAGAPGGVNIKFKDEKLQQAVEARDERNKEIKKAGKAARKDKMTTEDLNQEQLSNIKK